MTSDAPRNATLYRMVLSDHTCPFGVRALELLKRKGFGVEDRVLTTREDVDAFKAKHSVRTTPVIFIGEERIDGADELEKRLA